jgi:beta-1,2-mannobiose phosphorylase / 1,2-beta-oligomannan phosphorylase
MIKVNKHGVILQKTDLGFEKEGVLNPGVFQDGNTLHMFYRAVSKGNYSSVGYCKLNGPLTLETRSDTPILFPQHSYESQGTEDPRISKIDDLYYLSYTAYDGINALAALAISTNLVCFEKQGLIAPQFTYKEFMHLAESKSGINQKYTRFNNLHPLDPGNSTKLYVWDKNVVFFPRRIAGKLCFLHRIKPDIQIAMVSELSELTKAYWEDHLLHLAEHIVLEPRHQFEASYIGAGCPPIETPEGWILIYHGVHDTPNGYVYTACAALLDLENPVKEIARLPYALFQPEFEWELKGEVNNVCFPTGTAVFDDQLYIYYGAADERIACASVHLDELIAELLQNKLEHHSHEAVNQF